MQQEKISSPLWQGTFLVASILFSFFLIRSVIASSPAQQASSQAGQFSGRVVGASGATVHLVPATAMDITTRITASAIYAAPFPAEAYDEPLEDAIRLRGKDFPQATTDAQGNFVVASVPNGKFFVHVTPGPRDTEHLPGGDQSRRSFSAEALRGRTMTIELSSSPSPAARYAGSS